MARKYGLRPDSLKCDAFRTFDEGYSTGEVKLMFRHLEIGDNAPLPRTIKKYRSLCEKAQSNLTTNPNR